MSAGAAPTKAFRRIRSWWRNWAMPPCAACRAPDLANPLAVLACAKHYIGDGGTAFGSSRQGKGLDQGDTRVDEATLRRIHLPGYIAAIKAGVGSIMPSYSSWNGVKCSASKRLLTEILKQELGFQGFLISDYNAIDQIDPGLQEGHRHLHQRRHGHGDGAQPLQGIHRRPEATGGRGHGADGAHRRRRDAHSAREVRHGPDGPEPLPAGRPQPLEDASARPSTAPWRARRCANRWCC